MKKNFKIINFDENNKDYNKIKCECLYCNKIVKYKNSSRHLYNCKEYKKIIKTKN